MTIITYLKERKFFILHLFLISLIYLVVLFLYGCPLEPIGYAFVICMAFLIFSGILDYFSLKKKHQFLLTYDSDTEKDFPDLLPKSGLIEKDYQYIVSRLKEKEKQVFNTSLKKEQEASDFYVLWVHQIKTPIQALRLLFQTSPDNISCMKSELFKIERYVDIVLGYLRMEHMNNDLSLKQYSLESLVKQAVKKYSPLFIQSKLSLSLETLDFLVLTDEKWMVFVIEQLLSNALKYTPNGSIHIYGKSIINQETKQTTLVIQDTGIGIASEDLPRIFERGFTGYNGRLDKKASGLGLYLCKSILRKLGHEISITSQPEKGTCVTIHFMENKNYSQANLTSV